MTGSCPGWLHSDGMHDFIVREAEVGTRVALAEDEDACMGADFRLQVTAADLAAVTEVDEHIEEDGWF